jgi:CheY-like chemotaxis protein
MSGLLLVLDDDRERLRGFDGIAAQLGMVVRAWRTAPAMLAELDRYLPDARLISLDHDLYKDAPEDADPGSGRQVAQRLTTRKPVCPVIVHSTNTDAAWGMHNVLRRSGWTVELVHHLNQPGWIEERWLPVAERLAAAPAQPTRGAGPDRLTLAEYRALARALPVPLPQQVRQFAEYVAGAHSWYKHLPLLPAKTPIQVFLDPAAGMQVWRTPDGSGRAEIREESGFHYSWLRTADHHHRFGHLAFSKSSGSSVTLLSGDGSAQVPSDDAPFVYDPAKRAFYQLPEEALMAGRAFISAIVHTQSSQRWLWEDAIRAVERFDQVLEPIDGLEIGKRILDRCEALKRDPARAEPAPPRHKHASSLETLDVPLARLIEAERQRQVEELAAAATRVIRLARV